MSGQGLSTAHEEITHHGEDFPDTSITWRGAAPAHSACGGGVVRPPRRAGDHRC